jgi:hypothetical protein
MSSTCILGQNNLIVEFIDNVTGNVALGGATNPNAILDVAGNVIIRSNLDVKGSGTFENIVTLSNSSGNANIYSSGVNIGINDATPLFPLDVNGTIHAANMLLGTNSPSTLQFDDVATAKWQVNTLGYKLNFNNDSNGSFVTRMVMQNNGYLGIGTTAPAYPLDVNGSMRINSTSAFPINKLLTLFDPSSSDPPATACNFFGLGINSGTLRYQVPNGGINSHAFYNGTNEVARITPTGLSNSGGTIYTNNLFSSNIGVNTLTPKYELDVNGVLNVGGGTNSQIYLQNTTGSTGIRFNCTSTNSMLQSGYGCVVQHNSKSNSGDGSLAVFLTNATASAGTGNAFSQVLTITSNGYVGILDTTPLYPLDVNGAINALGYCNLLINSSTNASITNAPTCLALSNVYATSYFSSNTAVWASNVSYAASNNAFNSWKTNGNTIYTLSNVAIGFNSATENFAVLSNMSLSNYGKVIISSSNSYLGFNTAIPKALIDASAGNILAKNVCKLIKSIDTSNALTITLNWQTPYAVGNQYYILLDINQQIANQTACGIKNQRHAIGVSNYTKIFEESADVFGSMGAYTTLNLAVTASNSTSVTLSSSTNWVTTGVMSHILTAEVIHAPTTNIGTVWLS